MSNFTKRSLTLLLVLVLIVSFIPTVTFEVGAADFSYKYDGKYIYNWGERGVDATFLSPNAITFYETWGSYSELSSLSGGTNKSDVPTSALYKELQSIMTSAHTYINGYDANKNLAKYTDCELNGTKNNGKISSFYSGKGIGPTWGAGDWNREHTWPNSKGLGGNDENDIMMIRPTSTSENSSRGNTAYGKSSGYYNPNSESNGQYDLRGDVARIFLYVYVRWGNTGGYAWGSGGVMESVDVLIEWMTEDPVDTWELGRNDSVQSITGTRNIFVDYPELGFLLFGREIPDNYTSPSGEGSNKCDHNNFDSGVVVKPTCTTNGYTLYTCQTAGCGYSYKANTVLANGHTYVNGTCSVCGAAEPAAPVRPTYVTTPEVGVAYKLGLFSTEKGCEYFFNGNMSGYYGATDTAITNGIDVFVESVSGGYRLYFNNGSKQYINLVYTGTHYNFTFDTTASTTYTWDSAKATFATTLNGKTCYIGTYGTYVTMGVLTSDKYNDTDYVAHLYVTDGSSTGGGNTGGDNTDTPTSCEHTYNAVVTAPTCTKGGYTTYTCSKCGDSYTGNNTAATGHSYSGGVCISCGAAKPQGGTSETTAEIGFDSTANRTVFNANQQVWVANGITITNDKASSGVDVADFSNPARFYAGSNLTIEFEGMTKLVIDCTGLDSKYVSSWLNVPAGATATNNGGIITIVFNEPTNSITYTSLAKQSRAYSITAYAEVTIPENCEHTNTVVVGATPATCTSDGHTGITKCADCGEVIDEGSPIRGGKHSMGEWFVSIPATCGTAGEEKRECANCDHFETREIPAGEHAFADWRVIHGATCTEDGLERRNCDGCTHYETRPIAAVGHTDENNDGVCDTCGVSITTEGGNDNKKDGGNTVVIVAASVGGVSLAAVIFFILRKRFF